MIYPNRKGVAIMGAEGFIGKALAKRDLPPAVYFFDSPSSNILFDKELDYCMEETINSFLRVIQYCRDHHKMLVFPSSATIYNKNTSYARCKAILEEIALSYDIPFLGLRISAGYGPGESHKGEYASVIYQWCKQMKAGKEPVLFGDGTQTRDFVFEDDIAKEIEYLVRTGARGIIDIGTGVNATFNEVVEVINKVTGNQLKPVYIPKPAKYVPETKVNKAINCTTTLEQGVQAILADMNLFPTNHHAYRS